jgi:hypothetical protein
MKATTREPEIVKRNGKPVSVIIPIKDYQELLERAEAEFDLFITSDQNIRYQQNLAGRRNAILELLTNDLRRIEAAPSLIENAINELQPNEFKQLTIPQDEAYVSQYQNPAQLQTTGD